MTSSSELGESVAPVASAHGLSLVALFGSRASGAGRPGSDLDLGVLRGDRRPLGFRELGELQLALRERLGDDVEVSDLSKPDVVFHFEVVSRGRPLYEAPEGAWADFVARTLIAHDELAPFIEACIEGVARRLRAEASG
jgi:predicted nucleotidyltransferase